MMNPNEKAKKHNNPNAENHADDTENHKTKHRRQDKSHNTKNW